MPMVVFGERGFSPMKTISPWFRTASLLRSIQQVLAKTAQSQDEEQPTPDTKSDERRPAADSDNADKC